VTRKKKPAKKKAVAKRAGDPNQAVSLVPATWVISRWPADVFPFNPRAGKRLCSEHRDSLCAALVLSRPVREIVVHGAAYMKWIQSHASKVADYSIAPNSKAAD
jgi:hypothetical protein